MTAIRMTRARVRADYRDMPDAAFPKTVRLRHAKPKAECPEDVLQAYAEAVLTAKRIAFQHLPAGMFKAVFANPVIPVHVKRHLKDALAGWPDIVALLPITTEYNLCLCMELKTTTGKLHGLQKTRSREAAWVVARTRDEIDAAITRFEWVAGKMRADMERGAA